MASMIKFKLKYINMYLHSHVTKYGTASIYIWSTVTLTAFYFEMYFKMYMYMTVHFNWNSKNVQELWMAHTGTYMYTLYICKTNLQNCP